MQPLPRRLTIATWVFVLCCLLSSARVVFEAGNAAHVDSNDIASRSDQRFAALKRELPQRGIVGYVGESGESPANYYVVQYALAPLVIDHSPDHSLVISNFPSSPPKLPAGHLRLIKDFGGGVLLFAREDER
jgi:hypothetical protein